MSFPPNWKEIGEYEKQIFSDPLRAAWEFLRRNPQYQTDQEQFVKRLQTLGLLSDSTKTVDDATWHTISRDARAKQFIPPLVSGETYYAWQQRTGLAGSTVSIFDDFKTRWGIGGRPPDPSEDSPAIDWALNDVATVLDNGPFRIYRNWFQPRMGIGFNVAFPIEPQLRQAEEFLKARRDYLAKSAPHELSFPADGLRANRGSQRLGQMARVLDARKSGATDSEIGDVVFPDVSNDPENGYLRKKRVMNAYEAAVEMSEYRYLGLLTQAFSQRTKK